MKTLVIHPKDTSTDFLSVIYADKKDWTIVTDVNVSSKILKELIKSHDRIVMLGHGTEQGLIAWSNRCDYKHIINSSLVYLLREKQCVCIWCNADVFVKKYELKGFYTGMIISEYEEANLCCVPCKFEEIEESNILFADSVKKSIDGVNMLTEMTENYQGDSAIIEFNKNNLYFKNTEMEPVEILKNTDDDWYDNYENNQVKLKYIGQLSDGKFRVAVWGNDDFGIDKDFDTEKEAITMFDKLKEQSKINHKYLYDLGFTRF